MKKCAHLNNFYDKVMLFGSLTCCLDFKTLTPNLVSCDFFLLPKLNIYVSVQRTLKKKIYAPNQKKFMKFLKQ